MISVRFVNGNLYLRGRGKDIDALFGKKSNLEFISQKVISSMTFGHTEKEIVFGIKPVVEQVQQVEEPKVVKKKVSNRKSKNQNIYIDNNYDEIKETKK